MFSKWLRGVGLLAAVLEVRYLAKTEVGLVNNPPVTLPNFYAKNTLTAQQHFYS